MYQVLPHPHIGYFDGFTGDKIIIKKQVLELENQAKKIVWKYIETRIAIDDIDKGIPGQYCTNSKKT